MVVNSRFGVGILILSGIVFPVSAAILPVVGH